ncbi:hypothetical protein BC777_3882 [Yoonia maricola]|uniref:Uncharacterized protein n=1 Tax=Yoonia maricola TaxID=420999 RepID=A0A2M8W092_9RHOB|nr:hypothetical protein [Yoonia maricola]PJI84340.1 hypothetical protein BC777_3882 [Yoonia maricola]
MTAFERTILVQLVIAANVAAAVFIWGSDSLKFSILPWSIAWIGALMLLTQVTYRDGASKIVFSEGELGQLIFPIMSAMLGVFFASLAAIPLVGFAWFLGAI